MCPEKIVVGSWKTIYFPLQWPLFRGHVSFLVSWWGAGSVSWKVTRELRHNHPHGGGTSAKHTKRPAAHEARLTQKNNQQKCCKDSNDL